MTASNSAHRPDNVGAARAHPAGRARDLHRTSQAVWHPLVDGRQRRLPLGFQKLFTGFALSGGHPAVINCLAHPFWRSIVAARRPAPPNFAASTTSSLRCRSSFAGARCALCSTFNQAARCARSPGSPILHTHSPPFSFLAARAARYCCRWFLPHCTVRRRRPCALRRHRASLCISALPPALLVVTRTAPRVAQSILAGVSARRLVVLSCFFRARAADKAALFPWTRRVRPYAAVFALTPRVCIRRRRHRRFFILCATDTAPVAAGRLFNARSPLSTCMAAAYPVAIVVSFRSSAPLLLTSQCALSRTATVRHGFFRSDAAPLFLSALPPALTQTPAGVGLSR